MIGRPIPTELTEEQEWEKLNTALRDAVHEEEEDDEDED